MTGRLVASQVEFLRVLRESESFSEAGRKLGITKEAVHQRVLRLREHGLAVKPGKPKSCRRDQAKDEQVLAAMREHGNIHAAAKALGLNYSTVANRLERIRDARYRTEMKKELHL